MVRLDLLAWTGRLSIAAAVVFSASFLAARDRIKGVAALGKFRPEDETVELFAGIDSGQLQVRLIPRDARQCRVFVRNTTDKPLNVRFPAAFAGVPALAQAWDFQDWGLPDDIMAENKTLTQPVGGGFPPAGMPGFPANQGNRPFMNLPGNHNVEGMGPMGPNRPGALFNVRPEQEGQLKLKTVCLIHGIPNPRPKIKYVIKPIGQVTDKPAVRQVCQMLGAGQIERRVAQAAAWHLNNDKSWDALAKLSADPEWCVPPALRKPYFTRQELASAKKLTEKIAEVLKEQKPDAVSPGERVTGS